MYKGDRQQATGYYQKALQLDSLQKGASLALKELKVIPWTAKEVSEKWKLPFTLDELFAPPNKQEIAAISEEWNKRDLLPKEVTKIDEQDIVIRKIKMKATVISHKVHGYLHYGVVLVPDGMEPGQHPTIIELKGVSPGYGPLAINDLETAPFLCKEAGKFIYILPSYRGERLILNNKEYLSEGDRTDSWDGATDDALALVNAAISLFPQINAERIGVFGRSRGGSVALLAGIRDKRIKQVVALSGPVDWFDNMGLDGWTQ